MRNPFIFIAVFCLCSFSRGLGVVPNVVLMMADDMGMGDTSAYQEFTGNADSVQLYTPQMERLARMGMLFTDAHTPSSRCSSTRYGLLTGRYPWRNRLKYWVLFGVQGDPMIEADRPTLATLFSSRGYATAMVGKWHVGLRYSRADGSPADSWNDADLTRPLAASPLDFGFHFSRITSRSHGTSGPDAGNKGVRVGKNKRGDRNRPNQAIGPGHVHGRISVSANGNGKQLHKDGPNAYILSELGSRHSGSAMEFLNGHVSGKLSGKKPFFLYYAANSNHGPYTPDVQIGEKKIKGAGRMVSEEKAGIRGDFIHENDVALGRLIDYLAKTDDPRRPGSKLLGNTIVIFTSDNGAEIAAKSATGPLRSNKGSAFEGGHRVPFIVSWPEGGVGNGNPSSPGKTSAELLALQDLYATFSAILGAELPDLRRGEKGAEDSFNTLPSWRGQRLAARPLFHNDHKEAKDDPAACAFRLDSPRVGEKTWTGKWKLFLDAALLRGGQANPYALYDLSRDPGEQENLLDQPALQPLIGELTRLALLHRNAGGHRISDFSPSRRIVFDWRKDKQPEGLQPVINTLGGKIGINDHGLGVTGGKSAQVDSGEAILISFEKDVLIESAAIVAGTGSCGGFYRMGKNAPLAIYCVDADIDSKDQSGILSDLGVLRAGDVLRLDSSPHHGVEAPGDWALRELVVRLLDPLR
ncbi:MAG: arylsulfatase [Verrucomicrobiaceae bacterium]|nr:arylsulfatase [Verrucomicrobiaceae bacterium]